MGRECAVLAVLSGKGGVGKTLTAVNLALCAVREGRRVALVDADPLSNVMALLDQPIPEHPLPRQLDDPETQTFTLAPRFKVVLPQAKMSPAHSANLVGSLLEDHKKWLGEHFDMVIIDMPAGVETDGGFSYLAAVDALLLITTPEPTAHVAAGALLKSLGDTWKGRPVYLWHNKYEAIPEEAFDPDNIIGNYNRNVGRDDRMESPELITVAHVPPDAALDLSQSDPPVLLNMHRTLIETLKVLADADLPPLPESGNAENRSLVLVSYFLRNIESLEAPETLMRRLEEFIASETGVDTPIPEVLKEELTRWFTAIGLSPLRKQMRKVHNVAERRIAELEVAEDPGQAPLPSSRKALDKEIILLLKILSQLPGHSPLRREGGLLLFRFCLLKVFSSHSVSRLILSFLPRREENGRSVRDRRLQITQITNQDDVYRKRYFSLVKKLYPILSRQLDHLVTTFELQNLLFRDKHGAVAANAYVKLFSATLYEVINSGLGVVSGFQFRPSSRAFLAGFQMLCDYLARGQEVRVS